MNDKPAEKLNSVTNNGQSVSDGYDGLRAELEKDLGNSVKAEMDGMTEKEMIEVYENSNTLKGIVASKIQKLLKDRDEKKKKKIMLAIKFGTMMCLAGLIVLFATIAWFSVNKDVETSGMSIKAGYNGFELQVSGNMGKHL